MNINKLYICIYIILYYRMVQKCIYGFVISGYGAGGGGNDPSTSGYQNGVRSKNPIKI